MTTDTKAPQEVLMLTRAGLQLRLEKDTEGMTLTLLPLPPSVGETRSIRLDGPALDWFRANLDHWDTSHRDKPYVAADRPIGVEATSPRP